MSDITRKLIIILFVSLFVSGCSPTQQHAPILPIKIDTSQNTFQGVATQVDRRLVMASQTESGKPHSICAEPFPDGAAMLDRLKTLDLKVNGRELKEEEAYKFEVTIPFKPHPAVKFYRDGVFALCQAAMNGWISTTKTLFVRYDKGDLQLAASFSDIGDGVENVIKILKKHHQQPEIFATTALEAIRKQASIAKISEFEYQLYKLSQYVRDIFVAETEKEQAKARQEQAKACQKKGKVCQEEAKACQKKEKVCQEKEGTQ